MSQPTQIQYPRRAAVRTVFQGAVGLCVMAPAIVSASGVDEKAPWVAAGLAVTGGVARVMALPAVNDWLERFIPWLAPVPRGQRDAGETEEA
ncbi:MAG: hypothetical protein Q7V58_09410 [Actinomycetota bacterium]|nr:hypothetical protein [Actinomycetota bacterium]